MGRLLYLENALLLPPLLVKVSFLPRVGNHLQLFVLETQEDTLALIISQQKAEHWPSPLSL